MNNSEYPSRLIPEEYAAKLNDARTRRSMLGERRLVTILFCDVTGSTAMAETLDPEDWAEIMDDAFDLLIAPVYRYEGTIARLMGDAILAFFGAPIAHEDDPQRAILAGLAILKDMQGFREKIKIDRGIDFNVRVGINTGHVVVGEIGSDLAIEYTAMGDAVNLASRMEQTASPGTVQISETTHKLVAPFFDIEPLGTLELKGKRDPVPAYCVIRPKASPGSLRGIKGLGSPVVGRGPELLALRQAVEGVKLGRGGVILITGQAGLGKSRLLGEMQEEFGLKLPDSDFTPIELAGISYDSSSPYAIFRRSFMDTFEITGQDSPEQVWERVLASDRFDPLTSKEKLRKSFGAIWQLAGIQPAPDEQPLEGERFKRQLFVNYTMLWQQMASRRPLVVTVDDLHWVDPASVELLVHLMELVDTDPVLLVFAMRPHRHSPGWQIKISGETDYPHRYTEFNLSPLTGTQSDNLVANLLAIADLPPDLRQMILDKAEGNPFFIEEVIRTLIDGGILTRDDETGHWQATSALETILLPDSLQAILVSRIDRLDQEVRRTLQLASVIGRTFAYRVLERIDEAPGSLAGRMNTLLRVDLIRETRRTPELEYTFSHELSRDAAYRTILRRQRRVYHQRVGKVMEELFSGQLEQEADQLGRHFFEAGDSRNALKYFTMAGDHSAQVYANTEAAELYQRALDAAKQIQDQSTIQDEVWIHLYAHLGRTLELNSRYDEALECYQALQELAMQRDSKAMELAGILPQAIIHTIPSGKLDEARSQALTERSLKLARELEDPKAEARALWNQMSLNFAQGKDFNRGIEMGERSIALARQHGLKEELAFALNDIATNYLSIGQMDKVQTATEEARDLFRELDLKEMLADNLNSSAIIRYYMGYFDEAMNLAHQGLQISEAIANYWGQSYSRVPLGLVHMARGEISIGSEIWLEGFELARIADFQVPQIAGRAILAMALARLGGVTRARTIAMDSLTAAENLQAETAIPEVVFAFLDVFGNRPKQARERLAAVLETLDSDIITPQGISVTITIGSEIWLANGEFERVLGLIEERLPMIEGMGFRTMVLEFLYIKGRALSGLGQLEKAREVLQEARQSAEAIGYRLALWQILVELGRVEAEQGDLAGVEETRRATRDEATYIASQISDPEIRDSFLNLPAVRKALGRETT